MSKASTDWREAGRKADATRVMRAVSSGYDSWNKQSVRRQVVRSLVAVEPERVLELCAGGHGVRAMVAAGLSVLVVDDGRDERIAEAGISRDRYRRAVEVFASGLGQESRWGKAHKFTSEADAAFLDFMGQWSKEMRMTLESCRHMKAVAVTFMLDRMELGERGKLTEQDWIDALIGLAERTTFMRVRWWRVYRRNSYQQKALVLFLRPATRSGELATCACGEYCRPGRRKCDNCSARRTGLAVGRRSDQRYFSSDTERRRFHRNLEYQRHPERWARYYAEHADAIKERNKLRQRAKRIAAQTPRDCVICGTEFLSAYKRAISCGSTCRTELNRRRVRLAAVSGTAAEAVKD